MSETVMKKPGMLGAETGEQTNQPVDERCNGCMLYVNNVCSYKGLEECKDDILGQTI